MRDLAPVVAVVLLACAAAPDSDWIDVGAGQQRTISGMALVRGNGREAEFLIVHDNKQPGETRLALASFGDGVRYSAVPWPDGYALPVDLEAVTAVPDAPGLFVVATSGGTISVLHLDGTHAELRAAITLPDRPGVPNFEGFTLQRLDGALVAVWAQRGAGAAAGRLYWGRLTLDPLGVADVASEEIRVPYPPELDPNTRHISDLRVDRSGRLVIASAYDPGDAGPFESAVYEAGAFASAGGRVTYARPASLATLYRYKRKIEAIELVDDERTLALGTDDEFEGSAVLFAPRQR